MLCDRMRGDEEEEKEGNFFCLPKVDFSCNFCLTTRKKRGLLFFIIISSLSHLCHGNFLLLLLLPPSLYYYYSEEEEERREVSSSPFPPFSYANDSVSRFPSPKKGGKNPFFNFLPLPK